MRLDSSSGRGILAAVLLVACTRTQDKSTRSDSSSFSASSTSSALLDSAPVAYTAPAKAYDGPRIAPDSLVRQPLLELQGNEWVLRLPSAMARILYDSLPGFTPYQLSGFSASGVAQMLTRDPGAALPSLVVGDFNGDSTLDVGMEGSTAKQSAFLLLISRSARVAEPKLLIAWRKDDTKRDPENYMGLQHPQHFEETDCVSAFDLRHDAVIYGYSDKAASIYYVEKGALAQYSVSD